MKICYPVKECTTPLKEFTPPWILPVNKNMKMLDKDKKLCIIDKKENNSDKK